MSEDDIALILTLKVPCHSLRLIWDTWSQEPIKAAVLRALLSCQVRFGDRISPFDMADALTQRRVCLLHSYLLQVKEVHY